jgi:hypothetical protein
MRKLAAVLIVVAIGVVSYLTGYARAEREAETLVLAHSLEKTALCANGLNTLAGRRQEVTRKLLDHQLRSAVDVAERLTRSGTTLNTIAAPSLVDGVRRARVYADRVGDSTLSKRLESLYAKLAEGQRKVT